MGAVGHATKKWVGALSVLRLLQVQAENVQQAESLVRLTEKVESLNGDIQDTQQLIGALHGGPALSDLLGIMLRPVLCKPSNIPAITAMYSQSNTPCFMMALNAVLACRCHSKAAAACHAGADPLAGRQGPCTERLLPACCTDWRGRQEWCTQDAGGIACFEDRPACCP